MEHDTHGESRIYRSCRNTSDDKGEKDSLSLGFRSQILHDLFLGNPHIQKSRQDKDHRHDHDHLFDVVAAASDGFHPHGGIDDEKKDVSQDDEDEEAVFL